MTDTASTEIANNNAIGEFLSPNWVARKIAIARYPKQATEIATTAILLFPAS